MKTAIAEEEGIAGEQLEDRIRAIAADSVRGCENPNFGRPSDLPLKR